MELRKATRTKAKLRIGVSGPAGSGKSYSAILMAKGIVSDMSKVCIIDTESGSADLYSHLGNYNVIRMAEDIKDLTPYSPEKFIAAIKMAENAGMELCIIDSVTPEWDGKGGCLESNDKIANTKFKGNTWAAWSDTTPRHQAFIDAIVGSSMHIITAVRNKTDTVQTDDKKIKKVCTKEIQREGFEYELTVNFNIDRDKHYATASKDRTSIFDKRDPFVIDESTGKELKEWAELGVDPAEEAAKKKAEKEAEESAQNILKEKKKIVDMSIKLGFVVPTDKTQNIPALTAFIKATTNDDYRSDLPLEGLVDIAEHLSFTFNERAESAQGTLEI